MNSALPYRVMMTWPSRQVFEYCACMGDARRLSKVGLASSLPARRIQERRNGKWTTIKDLG